MCREQERKGQAWWLSQLQWMPFEIRGALWVFAHRVVCVESRREKDKLGGCHSRNGCDLKYEEHSGYLLTVLCV